ncbi:MAG: sensor histidine kinase [Bacteroidetes bacterium B1(2017)]|nr:MAG: sensor histidine kinase [Bacteroidetes bacterium B1(2017)]
MRIWAILLSIGNTAVLVHLLQVLFADDAYYQVVLSKSITLRFCYQVLMVATITILQWISNYMVEQKDLEDRKQQTERFAKEAELYNLRQQLQPHFLFNSLNSISALAGSKPDQARLMIQQLSEFLRHTLRKDEQQLITLEEELQQLQLYLEIEKVRFGNRLKSTISIDTPCSHLLLPVLVLQPLVENAIKFGLYDTLGEVEILIHARCLENKNLFIEISNPFDPTTHKQTDGTGFGLDSIKRRLYLLYASNDLVQTEINNTTFTVRINIPQNENN